MTVGAPYGQPVRCFRLALPGLACTAFVLAFFLDKAYTIDDPTWLRLTEHVLEHPADPMSFVVNWEHHKMTASAVYGSTAGIGYVLAPVVAAVSRQRKSDNEVA